METRELMMKGRGLMERSWQSKEVNAGLLTAGCCCSFWRNGYSKLGKLMNQDDNEFGERHSFIQSLSSVGLWGFISPNGVF